MLFARSLPQRSRRTSTALLTALTLLTPAVTPALSAVSGGLLALTSSAQASTVTIASGSVQLTFTLEQINAYANGQPVQWQTPPRLIAGRTMLPLRDTASLLGQSLIGGAGQVQLGRLVVDTRTRSATLAGVKQPDDTALNVGGVLYVNLRTVMDALNANLSQADDTGRSFTLTALRDGGNPLAPQARFSTDKYLYAPGERIIYTEYPFDPDGADITSRKWTNREDVHFQPGTYTISYTVANARGLQSQPFTRTIRVEGTPIDTPLGYALKYAAPGDSFPDPQILNYPSARAQQVDGPTYPLLFSDSPETPTQNGILYQDTVAGRARLLAYHLNGMTRPARLYILARNLENRSVEVRTERQGETAPTRIEGLLGQVTLLEYFANTSSTVLNLGPAQIAAVYASPTLTPGSGVNVMQDLSASGRVEITFLMLDDTLTPSDPNLRLAILPPDGRHTRGTFQDAVKHLRVALGQLPARIIIGDGLFDPTLTGIDATTRQPVRLDGNYGVLYDLEVNDTSGTAVALSPRGGLYRGAMNIQDGPLNQTLKLPRIGNALTPNQPVMLWRSAAQQLHIDFIPASGSNLPVSLVFYPTQTLPGWGGVLKNYQP